MLVSMGLDTGSKLVGWGVVAGGDGDLKYINSGVIKLNEDLRHPFRMARLFGQVGDLISMFKPDRVTIEEMSSMRNQKVVKILHGYITTATLASMLIGKIEPQILAVHTVMSRIGVKALTPQQKKAVKGTKAQRSKEISRLGKSRIRTVINAQFGLDIKEEEQDRADALAIALAGLG